MEAAARALAEGGRRLGALLQLREVCHFSLRFFLNKQDWNNARIR
jgi:hypothetical protein